MSGPTILDKLGEAVASCEQSNGELTGYALVTFHAGGFYELSTAAYGDDVEAIEVIEDLAETLGYNEEPEVLQ